MTKMIRWNCPNEAHPGVLGPSRPRRDDVRRYCLACSEKSGRLAERVSSKIEAKRCRAAERAKRQAKRRRERKLATMSQEDVNANFRCGNHVLSNLLLHHSAARPIWEVRTSKTPRQPRIEEHHVVIYDHDGADKYDARALTTVAELLWCLTCDAANHLGYTKDPPSRTASRRFIRRTVTEQMGIKPDVRGPLHKVWTEIALLLRAEAACRTITSFGRAVA